jgi:hypothetical protein
VYKIPCECRHVYIVEIGGKIEELAKEHQRDLWLYHPECSVVSGRSLNQGHQTYSEKLPYTRRVIWKATEINVHETFNREGGYQLNSAWKVIQMVKQQSECHRHTHDINTMWIKE